ncbi:MAG: serine hydrolase domain-containing protein, partial [Pseudomonadales bacterium]
MERNIELEQGSVLGWCDPAFESVLKAFVDNFNQRGEIGAGLAVYQHGTCLVNLQGGFSDLERGHPWQEDTLCVVHSCTKAATALCLHHLIDQADLQLNDPVTRYWPEYGDAGKGGT